MGRAEAGILDILRRNGQAYQAEIVRATGFSRGTVSEVIADLEERKMVRRSTEGRNSRIVYLGGGRRRGKTLRLGFTRSAEYPFLVPLKKMLKEDGMELEFWVYDNGISVARDLSLLRIDIGIAPLVTLFMMHSLEAPFKIIGPAGSGGSSLLEGRGGRCRIQADGERDLHQDVDDGDARAFRGAPSRHPRHRSAGLRRRTRLRCGAALLSGSADICRIWEPSPRCWRLRVRTGQLRYSELSERVCCAAAVGDHLGDRQVSKVARRYRASMDEFVRGRARDIYLGAYAALTGLDPSTLRHVEGEYSYPVELSKSSVVHQLEASGMTLPSPGSFGGAMFDDPS